MVCACESLLLPLKQKFPFPKELISHLLNLGENILCMQI